MTPTAEGSSTSVKKQAEIGLPTQRESPTSSATSDVARANPRLTVTAAEGTADAAFQTTLIAFQDGRLDLAFDFLPPSYQADLENAVHLFAEKMDSEIWTKGFTLMARLGHLMSSKKSLIMNLDLFKNAPQMEPLTSRWDSLAVGISRIASSEFVTLDYLKTCRIRDLLASANQLLVEIPLPRFGDVTVSTIRSDADSAILSYRETKSSEPKEVEFVRLDGKWLPKSIVTDWNHQMKELKSRITNLSESLKSVKPAVIQQFDSMGDALTKMQQANNSEEFNQGLFPLVFMIRLNAASLQNGVFEAMTSRHGSIIRIEVNRELDDDEQTRMKDAVLAKADQTTVDYEMIANDGKTRCRFSPVVDQEALVAVLQQLFEGADVKLQSETKTIHVQLK